MARGNGRPWRRLTAAAATAPAGYTLRINNRRCSKEQTPGIHSSVDAPPQRPSRTLQSVTSLHGQHQQQQQSTWSAVSPGTQDL